MSSDYLEDVQDDKETVVLLTMRVNGFAELTIMEADELIENTDIIKRDGAMATLRLPPNEEGIANATKIANALSNWVQHVKNVIV